MTYKTITIEQHENLAVLFLNRPEKLNAFTFLMMEELISAFDAIEADDHAILRNASEMGDLWASDLAPQLVDRFPQIILEANGTGLLQALLIDKSVDLVKLKEAFVKEGLLVFAMRRKLDDNIVVMVTPPLVIRQKEVYDIFFCIYKALLTI